jgi:hypothetical protein
MGRVSSSSKVWLSIAASSSRIRSIIAVSSSEKIENQHIGITKTKSFFLYLLWSNLLFLQGTSHHQKEETKGTKQTQSRHQKNNNQTRN